MGTCHSPYGAGRNGRPAMVSSAVLRQNGMQMCKNLKGSSTGRNEAPGKRYGTASEAFGGFFGALKASASALTHSDPDKGNCSHSDAIKSTGQWECSTFFNLHLQTRERDCPETTPSG